MFPIPDALAAFYLMCFAVGFLFVFASLFLGLTHDTLHLPGLPNGGGGDGGGVTIDHGAGMEVSGHGGGLDGAELPDGGHPGDAGGYQLAHPSGHGVSPINVSTIMAFLTWFGGAGYILRVYAGLWGLLSLVAAALVGLLGGTIIFYFLARVLLPGQRILDPADYRMVGTVARVTVPIRAGGIGEVVYSKGGSRHSEGAKSADGNAIERETEVVIVRYEQGIAYVEPWGSYVAKG